LTQVPLKNIKFETKGLGATTMETTTFTVEGHKGNFYMEGTKGQFVDKRLFNWMLARTQ
jgi:hypothetical protein